MYDLLEHVEHTCSC